ncbi:chaplin [Streptomyces sp. NPDC048179]|uniref:chaplin n=1 Tax=Streptomyces sp. NPDC048179 TaxID=3365506 RepID=UPI00371C5E55
MRQSLSRGMFAAAAATSILSLYASPALADSEANGATSGSPGVLSGNNVQAPVNVPVNICGNSVDAAAALNPAFGNSCANVSHEHATGRTHEPPHDSPGYGSEGPRETPPPYGHETPPPYGHETPPPYGDESSPPCDETPPPSPPPTPPGHSTPPTPPRHSTPPTPPGHSTPPSPPGHSTPPGPSTPPHRTTPPGGNHQAPPPTLAHTGTEALLASSAAGAALIAGGTILYRRGRTASRRP